MTYKIVTARNRIDLEKQVNALLLKGWKISYGLVVTSFSNLGIYFYQAMTKAV